MQRLRKRILSHLTLIKIIITIIVLLQTQACSDFANDPLDKNSNISISPNLQMNSIAIDNKLDKSVNVISKYLAIMLEDKEIRKSLALEFQLSKNHHKIIDCLSFLKKDISVNLKPAKVSDKILENLTGKEKNDLNNYINSMLTNYLFIGFPIKEHADNWLESKDILVAAVGDRLDGDESEVTAYNCKGNEIHLPANQQPKIPTLVIRTDKSLSKRMVSTLLPGDDGGGGGGGTTGSQYDVYVKSFKVGTDHEGIFDWNGMELYFKVAAVQPDGTVGTWYDVTQPIGGFEAGTVKDFPGYYGVGIFSTLAPNFRLLIQVWDADDGSGDDLVSDAYYWTLDSQPVTYFMNYATSGYGATRIYKENVNPNDIDEMYLLQRYHQ